MKEKWEEEKKERRGKRNASKLLICEYTFITKAMSRYDNKKEN